MKSNSGQFGMAQTSVVGKVPLDPRTIAIGLLIFAGYYLGAKIGFALTFQPHPVSVLWPPNSILVAALLLNSTPDLVVRLVGCISCTLGGAGAKSGSSHDDCLLVCQQLL